MSAIITVQLQHAWFVKALNRRGGYVDRSSQAGNKPVLPA